MQPDKLSSHVFKKGVFVTPINSIPLMHELSDKKSWTYGRMPEYIWVGLILKFYGREEGLQKLNEIVMQLHVLAPNLHTLRLSDIFKLDIDTQVAFYSFIIGIIGKEPLAPLTVIFSVSNQPTFNKYFHIKGLSIQERCDAITQVMQDIMGHQSYESTDIRFVALYFYLLSGKMVLQKEQIDIICSYPRLSHDSVEMRMVRPTVRSMEMSILQLEEPNEVYISAFWRCVSEMTECSLYSVNFPLENRKIDLYLENLYEIFQYLSQLYTSTSPIDAKMKVILGIATYSYKRFKEAYVCNLFNNISGRNCIRSLIENYIMLKYLIVNESSCDNIWQDYQLYGLGAYKLILSKHRENDITGEPHFDSNYIEMLVNEFKEEQFINIDTNYFNKDAIRVKPEKVDEKILYGLYYDYDSSFEHGLWGAIRESTMLKCNNPAHQYHCIPDIDDEIILKSVLPDCIMVMNKTIAFLNELYDIPQQLLNEVMNFELEPIAETDN